MWDWQGQDCGVEDNSSTGISNCVLPGLDQNEGHLSCLIDTTTPVKACGDLAYHVTTNEVMEKELEKTREHSAQAKRRRMLQFDSEVLNTPLFDNEMFLRSKETHDSLEDISSVSEWVAGFAEDPAESYSECLDPSSEGWIVNCFNDAEMQFNAEAICGTPEASLVQVETTEICNTPQYNANAVEKLPVHAQGNVVLRGRESYVHTPLKLASSVIYPFTFIKPCDAHGDVTLKDINQRIRAPLKSKKHEEDHSVSYPTSAFSGKPVVGKTTICNEHGGGSITILRTKG